VTDLLVSHVGSQFVAMLIINQQLELPLVARSRKLQMLMWVAASSFENCPSTDILAKVYVSKPNDYPHQPSKLLLFLTGGTGLQSKNNQLQADKFASEGFLVVMPDMFDNDYAPNSSTTVEETNLSMIEQIKLGVADVVKSFSIDMWLARQTAEKIMPILYKVLEAAREEFADAVASGGGIYAVGYCLGAKFLLQLASERPDIIPGAQKPVDEEAGLVKKGPHIKAGAIAHGTLVTKDDFEELKSPILLVCVENDQLFPQDTLHEGEQYLKEHNLDYQIKMFPEVPHG
jgi:dienelactone hydrolase